MNDRNWDKKTIERALVSIRALALTASYDASEDYSDWANNIRQGDPYCPNTSHVERLVESAFLQLLTLAEYLEFRFLHETIVTTYRNAKLVGLAKLDYFEDTSAWCHWTSTIIQFVDVLAAVTGTMEGGVQPVSVELNAMLRNMQNAITDKRCFAPPENETQVHDRIEAILRCTFPDLVRKPPMPKPITAFIADTGIPSISTIIEYKYLSQADQARAIANEILSDTRGYSGTGWNRMIFVIYETRRFSSLEEWRLLLSQCGVPNSTQLILLHGEEPIHEGGNRSRTKESRGTKLGKRNAKPRRLPGESSQSSRKKDGQNA